MSNQTGDKIFTRRVVLRGLGATIVMAPFGRLLAACGASDVSATGVSANGDAAATDATTSADATTEAAADAAADADVAWATGGTASMTGKASYPNPFASDAPTTCSATCELTEGPCYDSQSEVRADLSYGQDGLPVRMGIRILDDACKPVAGALVDVWHVAPTGKYSGDDSANEDVAFCTANDTEYTSHLYFRGKQTTDANGVVYFDTCFPGWYSSRTIHIHMTISIGGNAYLTTQLVFEDALDDEIVASQPIYKDRGSRDTTNLTDTVVSATTYKDFLFETEKMPDGAMLAWKTLIVRSSLSTTRCGGSGGTGGMPEGGPGEGGPPGDSGPPPGDAGPG